MEDNEMKKQQEEAAEIRRRFAQRRKECVDISLKLKDSIDVLEHVLKFEDVNDVNENGLGKINLHDFVWNILLWYPKQSVPFLVDKLIPLFKEGRQMMKEPHSLVSFLSKHISNAKVFRVVIKLFPASMVNDVLRIRSIDKCLSALLRLRDMLDEKEDGQRVNVQMLATMMSFLHVVFPTRTSEFVSWMIDLYKQCQKINATQIKGFSALSRNNETNKRGNTGGKRKA